MSRKEEIVADQLAEAAAIAGMEIYGGEVEQNMRGGWGFEVVVKGKHFDVNVVESGR